MALPSEELLVVWRSLDSTEDQAEGWRSGLISRSGAVILHAGRRFPGALEAVLVKFGAGVLSSAIKFPEGAGFRIERVSYKATSDTWLALTRKPQGSLELFAAMACDIVDLLDTCPSAQEAKGLAMLLGRARAWQEFMRKGSAPLQAEAEVGLFGELAVLRAIMESGIEPTTACEAWRGPIRGLRDFEIGTGSIEVKSTLAAAGFPARIRSLEQLDDTFRQPLFIAGVRLQQGSGGLSLPDAVAAVRDIVMGHIEAERLFAELLIAAGYLEAHAGQYSRRFELIDSRFLHVVEGFPRMTPSTVPKGITWASYDIDLEQIQGQACSLFNALLELKAI